MDNKDTLGKVVESRATFKTRSEFRYMKEALSSEELFDIIQYHKHAVKSSELIDKIRIFDIEQGELSEKIRFNPLIRKVFTIYDLKEALANNNSPVFMIPSTAAIDRLAVSEICEYYRCVKTIFFEHAPDNL